MIGQSKYFAKFASYRKDGGFKPVRMFAASNVRN